MATLNKSFTTILALLTITTIFSTPSKSAEAPTQGFYEAPSPDERYAQNLPKSFKEFVMECAKKMATHCSEEVVISLFNATKVSDHCCQKLVEMGMECHKALVRVFVGLPEAKGYKNTILENGDKVYNECALVVKDKPIAPSPSPSSSPSSSPSPSPSPSPSI